MPCTWSLKIKNVLSFYHLVGNFMAVAVDLVSLIVYSQFKKCGIPKAISSNKESERQVQAFEWQENLIFHHQNINIVQRQSLSLKKM